MNRTLTKTAGAVVAMIGFVAALPAYASISFSVDGVAPTSYPGPVTPPANAPHVLDGLGYPGDTVGLQGANGSFELTPGTSIQQINTLNWTVAYTYAGAGDPANPDAGWQQLLFPVNLSRELTIGSQTVTLSQTGLLEVNWDNDYLSFSAGSTVSLYVGGYRVDITPLAVAREGASNFSGDPGWVQPDQVMRAQFDVTPVPEPTTMLAGALLLLPFGLSTLRKLRTNGKP